MKTKILGLLAVGLLAGPTVLQATPVTFYATGVSGVSGSVQFNTTFNGTNFQLVSNSTVTGLSLDVFGQIFTLSDVVTAAGTLFDSTGALPLIVNGSGNLADNGLQAIAFFPDGFAGTSSDGDASLAVGPAGRLAQTSFYAVRWSTTAPVPEPGTLALLGIGLLGLGISRRKA